MKGDLEQYPEGKAVSGAFVVTYLDKAYYLYGANITDDGGLNANKACVLGHANLYDEKGIRSFDFFGVSGRPRTSRRNSTGSSNHLIQS